jgi:hypothetical protein
MRGMGHAVVKRRVMTAMAAAVVFALVVPAGAAVAAGVPSPPRSVAAAPGNRQVTVSWRPPSSTGGAAINRYRVVRWRAGTTNKQTVTLGASARQLVVTSLTNGTRYYFQVAAHNSHGWGSPSAQISAVPRTTPSAPKAVRATPTDGAMDLAWAAPASNGGAAVNKYAVRHSQDGGQTWSPAVTNSGTGEVTTRSTTVGQLEDGTPYDGSQLGRVVMPYLLQVRAHNAAGWGPWERARLASAAREQMPPFVPSNLFGNAAAAAFRDYLTGSYWTDGYPTVDGAGEWHDGGPLTFPIQPNCTGNPTVACQGGQPQDPPPSLVLDFTAQSGDTPRRTVSNITGASRYDLTYRARVTTSTPIETSPFGADCTISVDSTQGTSPDLWFSAQVNFSNVGWQTRPATGSVTVQGLEDADFTMGGSFVCNSGSSYTSLVEDVVTEAFADSLFEQFTESCGTDEPFYWQPCYPILDNPPPLPPAAEPVASCPGGPPEAGPYMTVSCSGSTLVRSCANGWVDLNKRVADGCERSAGGIVPLQVDATTAPALADHLSGSFYLGGYPSGTGTGSWYTAPNPLAVALPRCGTSMFGCPQNFQQSPMPTLLFDLSEQGEAGPRRQGSYDAGTETAQLTLRGRVHLTAPVAFRHQNVGCDVQIDTTAGQQADIELNVAAQESESGSLSIVGYYDGDQWFTLRGLEDDDMIFGPHRWCAYWAPGVWRAEVRTWVRDALVAWAQRQGTLCGAPDPYYWQPCPSS